MQGRKESRQEKMQRIVKKISGKAYDEENQVDEDEERRYQEFLKEKAEKLKALKAKKLAEQKLPTEKRHKDDYKRLKGNIQKSRSDLRVNKKTGKREITTQMTIHKGLTAKEKAGLKKSILKAVKQHLEGSGLHIPLVGGYTSSLIFHEMGKYIPPKDRKLMKKLIEESRPPRPPPIHSGAIDEEDAVAVVKPMDDYDHEARIRELNDSDSETDSEQERHDARIRELNDPDSDSDSDDEMFGSGFNPIEWGFKTAINKTEQGLKNIGNQYLDAAKRDLNRSRIISKKAGTGFIDDFYGGNKQDLARANQSLADNRANTARLKEEVLARNAQIQAEQKARRAQKAGTGIKRPRGRPRKIQL